MEEAERLCDRVAIIDHGRIIKEGSPAELIRGLGAQHVIEFALERAGAGAGLGESDLLALPAVTGARLAGDGACSLTVSEPARALPALIALVSGRGAALARLETRHATLEDVFVTLTGRHLRDA
jgi:ABC-2 type transport system ATP-binding protein